MTAPTYEELAALVVAQERIIAQLQARIAEQDARIAEQDARIAELERQLAASSRNSSKRSFLNDWAWQPGLPPVLSRLRWVIEELVPDGLWERVAPLLPPPKPRRYRYPGRRPIEDRAALAGIVFVLKTGITWNQLPTSLVGCSGVTCWRRLRDWTAAGVWPVLHEQLLAQLRALDELDLDCCAVDGSHVRALNGGTTWARLRSTAAGPAPRTT